MKDEKRPNVITIDCSPKDTVGKGYHFTTIYGQVLSGVIENGIFRMRVYAHSAIKEVEDEGPYGTMYCCVATGDFAEECHELCIERAPVWVIGEEISERFAARVLNLSEDTGRYLAIQRALWTKTTAVKKIASNQYTAQIILQPTSGYYERQEYIQKHGRPSNLFF